MVEAVYLIDNHFDNYRNKWEQTRQICYQVANVMTEKHIQPFELMPFSWDNIDIQDKKKNTKEDIEALKKRAEETAKLIQLQ